MTIGVPTTWMTAVGNTTDIVHDTVRNKIAWRTTGLIERADIDGTNRETVLAGVPLGEGLTFDPVNDWFIFGDNSGSAIRRIDGATGANNTVITSGSHASVTSLDYYAGDLYWRNRTGGFDNIRRMGTDGTGLTVLVAIPTANDVQCVAIDQDQGFIFWNETTANIISAAQLSPFTAKGTAVASAGLAVSRIDYSPELKRIYWTEQITGEVRSADALEPYPNAITALYSPSNIQLAVQVIAGVVYASDFTTDEIVAIPIFEGPLPTQVTGTAGDALNWTVWEVASVRVAGYDVGGGKFVAWEGFELGWLNDDYLFIFGAGDTEPASYLPEPDDFESFELGWDNDLWSAELVSTDPQPVEDMESGWSTNENWESDFDAVASAGAVYDSEAVEDFEEQWRSNESFVFVMGATDTAQYDTGGQAFEDFEDEWPLLVMQTI